MFLQESGAQHRASSAVHRFGAVRAAAAAAAAATAVAAAFALASDLLCCRGWRLLPSYGCAEWRMSMRRCMPSTAWG